jgi:hypothetical protein
MMIHDTAMITGTAMSKCSTLLYKVPLPPQVLREQNDKCLGMEILRGWTYDKAD